MSLFRLPLLLLGVILTVSWFTRTGTWKKTKAPHLPRQQHSYAVLPASFDKLQAKAMEARQFTRRKKLNEKICFLIDMSLPSGQKRFFIYDLQKDSLRSSALVAHGNCFENWLEGRRYSNTVGSGCTSLGRYKIGIPYTGKWGYSYKLHGLDSTNSNAYERTVVLHGHSCVPDGEVADEICQSNGCPTVHPAFLLSLKRIIQASPEPVLLWIYE